MVCPCQGFTPIFSVSDECSDIFFILLQNNLIAEMTLLNVFRKEKSDIEQEITLRSMLALVTLVVTGHCVVIASIRQRLLSIRSISIMGV